jgi:hypothetical protein
MIHFAVWQYVSVEYKGRRIEGSYTLLRDEMIVHLKTKKGEKVAYLDDARPIDVARRLLVELASECYD